MKDLPQGVAKDLGIHSAETYPIFVWHKLDEGGYVYAKRFSHWVNREIGKFCLIEDKKESIDG